MFPNAILYDYQHGLISLKYNGYLNGNSVANHIIINKSNVLLHGKAIKNKLLNLKEVIFQKTFLCSRLTFKEYNKPKTSFNGNILFTLQFTNSHSVN